jgi:UDP-N-acetylmuramoylalanine--D-glutamate ligase
LEALEHALPKVHAAGLTALAPDHLERHGTLSEYLRCKAKIFDWLSSGATALLPGDWWNQTPFAEVRRNRPELDWQPYGPDQTMGIRGGHFHAGDTDLGALADFHEHGGFQQQNLLLAMGLALSGGVTGPELAVRLPLVSGLAHRLQRLPGGAGPTVFDNGVSTTPETTLAAVQSLPAPLVLLVGGQVKAGLAYSDLAQACIERGDRVHLFGAACEPLKVLFQGLGDRLATHPGLASAIQAAWQDCRPDQVLLFSPACASFDEFANFQARAVFFLERVAALKIADGGTPTRDSIPFQPGSSDL